MSVAAYADEVSLNLEDAFEDGVINADEYCFLESVAAEMDMNDDDQEMLVLLLVLARARMNGSPDQVPTAIREAVGRDTLTAGIAALPDAFADEVLLRSIAKHMHWLDGHESHEAIAEICRRATPLVGTELGGGLLC